MVINLVKNNEKEENVVKSVIKNLYYWLEAMFLFIAGIKKVWH